MKDNEKEMKLELLDALMGKMDDSISSKLKPKVLVKEEKVEEMPLDEAKEMIQSKMMGDDESDSEEVEMEMEEPESEENEGMSSMMKKLQALRSIKK